MFYIDCNDARFLKAKLSGKLIADNDIYISKNMDLVLKVVDSYDNTYDFFTLKELLELAYKYPIVFANCYFAPFGINASLVDSDSAFVDYGIVINSDYSNPLLFNDINHVFIQNANRLYGMELKAPSDSHKLLGSSNYYIHEVYSITSPNRLVICYNSDKIYNYRGCSFNSNNFISRGKQLSESKILCLSKDCRDLYVYIKNQVMYGIEYCVVKFHDGKYVNQVITSDNSKDLLNSVNILKNM